MPETLDPREVVSIEELAISNRYEITGRHGVRSIFFASVDLMGARRGISYGSICTTQTLYPPKGGTVTP
jgi:hypothetical protein